MRSCQQLWAEPCADLTRSHKPPCICCSATKDGACRVSLIQQGCERPIPGGPLSHMPARLVALVLILSFMFGTRMVEVAAAPLIIKGCTP